MSAALSSTHRLVSLLGQGGNGIVYLAVAHGPEGVDKLVVLKALRGPVEPSHREQLMSEARVAVLLNHPNVIQTFGVTVQEGRPVISMEFLDGQPLSQLLEKAWKKPGVVPLSVWLRIVRDVLRGLQHAHELSALDGTRLGLVHRDITPQNVFVTFDGGVKVLDFGLAKTVTSVLSTAPGVAKGSLRYMSPEQVQLGKLDRRSDIFSVGVLLWEMLAGERLWRRFTETGVMQALCGTSELRSPQALSTAVADELARITLKALALKRAERYACAAELQADLEAYGGLATDAELAPRRCQLPSAHSRRPCSLLPRRVAPETERQPARALHRRRRRRANDFPPRARRAKGMHRRSRTLVVGAELMGSRSRTPG